MRKLRRIIYKLSFFPVISFFNNIFFNIFAKPLISVRKGNNFKNKPFYIIISIDTESGYTTKSEDRLWQVNNPKLFQGFYYGIKNWLELLDRYKIKGNFMISSQCFDSKGNTKRLIIQQLSDISKKQHEIGYHLHPKSDLALENQLNRRLNYTSSKFYNEKQIDEFLKSARTLLRKNLGEKINREIISFRWGNYGLYNHALKALDKNGFLVDSSACPQMSGHERDDKIFSWKNIKDPFPFYFQNSKILEIPITTFYFLNRVVETNPIFYKLLNIVFYKYWKLNNMVKKPFFFTIVSHSSEATYKDGKKTKMLLSMESFINYTKRFENVRFITYQEAYNIFNEK